MLTNFCFFGTDDFAVSILEGLKAAGLKPNFIVSTPDKPKGRKLLLTPPAVATWAEVNKIECLQPTKLDSDFVSEFSNKLIAKSCKLSIVASYGKILPASLLSQPKYGFVNIHPSLLPKYRGATPLQSAILSNDTETGVTLMEVDAEMDHGSIIAQEKMALTNQTFLDLREQAAKIGVELILNYLPKYLSGELKPVPQNHSEATFTKKIEKTDGELKDEDTAETNYKKFRAYTPWPGVYFFQDGMRVIIKQAHLANGEFIIERVVAEGKKEMDYSTFTQSLE